MDVLSRIGLVVLATLVVVVGYLMYNAGRFKALTAMEAMDCGQLAWNLAQGEGYTTNVIRPLSLASHPQLYRHPELRQAPLHPYIASLLMRVIPEKPRALALSCGVGFLLTAPIIFLLGWHLFDLRTGIIATALYVTNLAYLQYAISGLPVTWVMFFVSLLFLTCYHLPRKQRLRLHLAAAAGALVGLIYLTAYLWLAVLPVIGLYVFFASDKRDRWVTLLAFAVAFIIIVAPWCVRNANLTGNPFFTYRWAEDVMGTRSNPGNTLHRQFTPSYPSLLLYAIDRPMEMIEKARAGLIRVYPILSRLAGTYLTPFFLAAMLVTMGPRAFERLRWLWYGVFAALVLMLMVVAPMENTLVPMAPLAVVIATGFFLRLVDARLDDLAPSRYKRLMGFFVAGLLVLHCIPLATDLFRFGEPEAASDAARQSADAAREVVGVTTGSIVTDVPWLIAWYTDTPAIWLPKTRVDLRNLQDKMGKITWLLMTPQVASPEYDRFERMLREWGMAWNRALRADIDFEGYSVQKRLADGRWILLRADARAKRDLQPPETDE